MANTKTGKEIQFDPALKEILLRESGHHLGAGASAESLRRVIPVIARLRSADADVPGLNIVTRMGEIVTGRVAIGDIVELREHPQIASLKASAGFAVELHNSVREIHATPSQLPAVNNSALTGRNTIVGIVDWGVDPVHESFRDRAGNTRLRAVWDQRGGRSKASPDPYGYGRLMRRSEIDRALSSGDPYGALDYDPAQIDPRGEGTHGTHVMSIAAGSGRIPGIAPGADLIFVHLRGSDTRPEDTLGDSVRLLEAVDFILQEAGEIPVSINLSLGRTGDAKDGSSPVEQALDAVVQEKPGRVISMSTGNYFGARLHSEGQLPTDGSVELRWQLPPRRRQAEEMEVWYAGNDELEAQLIAPNGDTVLSVARGESGVERVPSRDAAEELLVSLYHRESDPNNADNMINVFIHPRAAAGQWRIRLLPREISNGYFHAWIERSSPGSQSRFHPEDASDRSTIGTICCGHSTLACGAYSADDRLRRLGDYRSAGPSRDLRQIPIISAPGDKIIAAQSSTVDALGFRQHHRYSEKSGTSMAAPHCTGVVALMMEAALPRRLSVAEVREILTRTARRPALRYQYDELRYGSGLLDASAAVEAVLQRSHRDQSHTAITQHHANEERIMNDGEIHTGAVIEASRETALTTPENESPYEWLTSEAESASAGQTAAPESGSTAYEWLLGQDGEVQEQEAPAEYARPTLVEDRAVLEWQNLNLVTGGDGQPHLYYLTTGDPDNNRATFNVKISNTTSNYMRNATIKWRLSSLRPDGTYRTVLLHGQPEGQAYFSSSAPSLPGRRASTRTLLVSRPILQAAYESDSPRCRLEVEYHWYERNTPYYARHVLGFFLFHPVEFLFRSARNDGEVSMRDNRYRADFWMPVRGKQFSTHDQQPVNVSLTITTGLSSSSSEQRSVGSRMTASASVTQGQSTTVGTETGSSLSVGIEKVLEVGVSSSMSTSQTRSIEWSSSVAQEFSRQIVHSRAFSSSYSRTQQVNWTIQASPPGTVRTLFAYPVFNRKRVRVVNFGRANSRGQAVQRRAIDDFPVLLLSRWVDISEVTGGAATESATLPTPITQVPNLMAEGTLQNLPKLRASQVSHLVLEGGGGKGIVYLGAIEALQQLNVLRFSGGRLQGVQGIAGSSAGAITALALSLGMDYQGLLRLFRGSRRVPFNEFFDLPSDPRKLPRLYSGCTSATRNSVVDRHIFGVLEGLIKEGLDAAIPDVASHLSSSLDPERLASGIVDFLRRELHSSTVDQGLRNRGAEDKLLSSALLYYLINLVEDLGFFSGCRARAFFDSLIAQRTGGQRNMTFAQHRSRFQTKLVITGSNMETGRNEYFSADTTPHMAVADAVRISVSLPLIYKPVRISAAESRRITGDSSSYQGLWVDGGLWNNLPLSAFGRPTSSSGTLGIRLGIPQRVQINGFMDFLKRYLIDFGVFGAGETNQSASAGLMSRVITLNTGDLDTTEFSPPASVSDPLIRQAKSATLAYFN